MAEELTLAGYGTNATLAGRVLTAVATSALAGGVLGAARRSVPVTDITALEFQGANALRNGSILIQSSVGKTVLHFRRKQAESARILYEALQASSPALPGAKVTAEFANERRDARAARAAARTASSKARLEQRKLESAAILAANRAEFQASRARAAAQARTSWEELKGGFSSPATRELAEFLDAVEASEARDVDDEVAGITEQTVGEDGLAVEGVPDRTQPASDDVPVAEFAGTVLDDAEVAAHAGDVANEEYYIRVARSIARAKGQRSDRKEVEANLERRIQQGTLRRQSRLLGVIESESGFERWARSGARVSAGRGEKRIEVWSDRIITNTVAYPITAQTGAEVYLDGQVIVTQRPTLTRMALFAPLPGSALLPGLAAQKKETTDRRRAEVQIRDVNWSLRAAVNPDAMSVPRQLAEQVNSIAVAVAQRIPTRPPDADLLTQLERLALLIEKGVVSAVEAERIKQALLP